MPCTNAMKHNWKNEIEVSILTNGSAVQFFWPVCCGVLFFGCLSLLVGTRCRGLTFTFASVLVRAPIDGQGSQTTHTGVHARCVVRALMPIMSSSPLHVFYRQETMQQNFVSSVAPPHPSALCPAEPMAFLTKLTRLFSMSKFQRVRDVIPIEDRL